MKEKYLTIEIVQVCQWCINVSTLGFVFLNVAVILSESHWTVYNFPPIFLLVGLVLAILSPHDFTRPIFNIQSVVSPSKNISFRRYPVESTLSCKICFFVYTTEIVLRFAVNMKMDFCLSVFDDDRGDRAAMYNNNLNLDADRSCRDNRTLDSYLMSTLIIASAVVTVTLY